MNNIYKSGKFPEEFARNIFITIPKVSKAQECKDFRTISLISHTSKILLHLIKRRITPIIERLLAESQMGIRKGKGTRDAIFLTSHCNTTSNTGEKEDLCMLCGLPKSL